MIDRFSLIDLLTRTTISVARQHLTNNFAHLREHDEQLLRLGMLAQRYFPPLSRLLQTL